MRAQSLQLCLTLCNPLDISLPGFSAHGISQARILEWVAMPSSGSSWSRDWTYVSCVPCIVGEFFTTEPQGSPECIIIICKNNGFKNLSTFIHSRVREKWSSLGESELYSEMGGQWGAQINWIKVVCFKVTCSLESKITVAILNRNRDSVFKGTP